jgi:hypothetical protein
MSDRFLRAVPALVALLAAGSLACGDSGSTAPTPPALSQAQADSVGETIAIDAGEMVEAATFHSATGIVLSAAASTPPAGCVPTITPFPPTDTDGDVVPDSVRFDFTECSFTRGVVTHTLSGMIDVIDPTPAEADFNIRSVFTAFQRTLANSATGHTVSALYDGTRQVSASPDTLGHTITAFLTEYTYANGATATHVKDWVAKFTADVPGSIALGEPLPAGVLALNGTSNWTRMGQTWQIATSTAVPLHFDPTCTLYPRLDAGKLVHVVTRLGATTTFEIVFTACGEYTVTKL